MSNQSLTVRMSHWRESIVQVSQNHRVRRRVQNIFKAAVGVFLLCLICMFVSPARNLVLWPFWPNAWRKMNTLDIIQIEISELPHNVTALEQCSREKLKPLAGSRLHTALIKDYAQARNLARTDHLRESQHRAFLPALTFQEKVNLIWLFAVMAHALSDAGVEFFMRGGSLLGLARHQGIIPWDDDIDIALNVSDWTRARDALSCLQEYHLSVQPNMHWKFNRADNAYPFIDMFFYTENARYIWALTDYTRRTFTLLKEDVLPLRPVMFEGITVLVPQKTQKISKELYSYGSCESRSLDHKSGVSFPTVIAVPCSSLSYLYDMYGLDD